MAKYLYMVLVSPKEGRLEDWKRWHAERHSLDMLSIDGMISCRRFEIAPSQPRGEPVWQVMVLYELETDDLDRVLAEAKSRYGTESMPKTDASDPTKTVSVVWIPLSEQFSTTVDAPTAVQP